MNLDQRLLAFVNSVGADIKALFSRALPAGGTTGQVLVKASATDYAVAWANDQTGSGGAGVVRTVRRLTAAHANSTVTSTTITDGTTMWSHSCTAGKAYRVNIIGTYQTVALTTGMKLSINGSALGTVLGSAWGAVAQATAATALEASLFKADGTAGSFILTTAVSPINSPHHCGMEFIFSCTTTGILSFQFASEVAASAAQLNAGSCFIVEEL